MTDEHVQGPTPDEEEPEIVEQEVDEETGELVVEAPEGTPEAYKPTFSYKGAGERRKRFAELYCAVGQPTFESGYYSLRQVYLELGAVLPEGKSGIRMATRYLRHPDVIREIERIQAENRITVQLTVDRFVERVLDREEMLARRGGRGDSQAAAAYMKMAGEALGFFVKKVEDVTKRPEDSRPLEERVAGLVGMLERIKRLSEPAPLPPGLTVRARVLAEAVPAELAPVEEGPPPADEAGPVRQVKGG